MRGYEFKVPSPYSEVLIPGTVYIPDGHGRMPVCYICPDMASSRNGPYGILEEISGSIAGSGTAAVLFDTAGCGERADEEAAFLDQDTYDLDRVRAYIKAGFRDRIGEELLAGYGAGAMTAVSYAPGRDFSKLILIAPLLTWKGELDMMHRGRLKNPECGKVKCRKTRDYVDELEFRSVPSTDGMNAAMHQLAGGYSKEIRAVCGDKDGSGTPGMLRAFEPYYRRRKGELGVEMVHGVGHRQGLEVPELKMRLFTIAQGAILRSAGELERHDEDIER